MSNTSKLSILWNHQKGLCYYCGIKMLGKKIAKHTNKLELMSTVDHKIPKSKGGGRGDNIVLACNKCNKEKADMTEQEYIFYRRYRYENS